MKPIIRNNRSSFFLFALLLSFCFYVAGCGQGVVVPDNGDGGWIETRYPGLGGSVSSKNGNLTVTFNRDMDTNYNNVVTGESHNAGEPAAVEAYWIDNRTFSMMVSGPLSGGTGNTVQMISDTGGFRDSHGASLLFGTEIWRFSYDYNSLESYSISGEVSQSYGTPEGMIYVLVYDHDPSGYGDLGFIGYASMESPGGYIVSDLGHGTRYVRAYRDGFGSFKWYRGFPSGLNGPVNLNSGNATGVDIVLSADPLSVVSVTPSINQENVAVDQDVSITFNNAILPSSISGPNAFAMGPSHEAGFPISDSSPEFSADLRTMTVRIDGWAGGTGPWVNIVTTSDAHVVDCNGSYLDDGTDIWKYKLATYSVSGTVTGGTTGEIVYVGATTTTEVDGIEDFFAWVTSEAYSFSYTIPGLIGGTYYIMAFRDEYPEDGWLTPGVDYVGEYLGNPVEIPPSRTGVSFDMILYP